MNPALSDVGGKDLVGGFVDAQVQLPPSSPASTLIVLTENSIRLFDRAVRTNHVTLSVDDRHDKVGARDRPVSV